MVVLKLKYFKMFKTFLIFSFIIFILTACEIAWFGDIKTDLRNDANSILRFFAQKQEDNPETQCVEINASISEIITAEEFPYEEIDIIKPGYHINYWCYYRDPNNQNSGVPSNISFDSNVRNKVSSIKITPQYIDFYAEWAPNTDTKYTVEHYFQNLTLDDYEIDSEKTQILTGTTDEPTNGKAYTETGFEAKSFEQINIDGDGSAVLKIYYNRCAESIVVDYGDGSNPVEFKGYYGQKVEGIAIPDRSQQGYDFDYWKIIHEDGTTDVLKNPEIRYTEHKEKYVCVWKEKVYKITWVLEQTNLVVKAQWISPYKPTESYTVSTGCTIPSAENISRRGYTFAGWYSDSSYTTPAADWTNGQTGDKTLYAKWIPVVYTISYEKNGGVMASADPSSYSYTIEDNVTLPAITRTGWIFNGWFAASDFSGTQVSSWNSGDRNENITFYAKWTEKTSQISGITITYPVENDATLTLNVGYSKETDIWTYSVASGYTSYQWFYDENQIVSWSGNSGTATSAASGLTLTAGYHNILVVVTDSSGTQYSASAIVQVVK